MKYAVPSVAAFLILVAALVIANNTGLLRYLF